MAAVLGQFNYFQWSPVFKEEKPYYLYTDPPPGQPNANFSTQPGEAEIIHDVRGKEKEFNLDDNGFAFGRQDYPHTLKDMDDVTIKTQYLPSLEVMIRDLLQQECEIFWFDWRVRALLVSLLNYHWLINLQSRSSDDKKSKFEDGMVISLENRSVTLAPIMAVHVGKWQLHTGFSVRINW